MPQDAFLFNATIEENIRYGKLDATKEEIMESAKRACLHDFIQMLPNQYETIVGPRGARLSGGQRQRLGMARLILKNAPIWILDEFTSALDSRLEASLYDNLLPQLEGKTAIIIAHRLSTILSADRIIVLHDGKIREAGSHDELYRRGGIYKNLFDRQFHSGNVEQAEIGQSGIELLHHQENS